MFVNCPSVSPRIWAYSDAMDWFLLWWCFEMSYGRTRFGRHGPDVSWNINEPKHGTRLPIESRVSRVDGIIRDHFKLIYPGPRRKVGRVSEIHESEKSWYDNVSVSDETDWFASREICDTSEDDHWTHRPCIELTLRQLDDSCQPWLRISFALVHHFVSGNMTGSAHFQGIRWTVPSVLIGQNTCASSSANHMSRLCLSPVTRYIALGRLFHSFARGDTRRPHPAQNSIKPACFVHLSPSTPETNAPSISARPSMSSQQNANAIVQQASDKWDSMLLFYLSLHCTQCRTIICRHSCPL